MTHEDYRKLILSELAKLQNIPDDAEEQLTDQAIEKYRAELVLYRSGDAAPGGWLTYLKSALMPFLDPRLAFVLAGIRDNEIIKDSA